MYNSSPLSASGVRSCSSKHRGPVCSEGGAAQCNGSARSRRIHRLRELGGSFRTSTSRSGSIEPHHCTGAWACRSGEVRVQSHRDGLGRSARSGDSDCHSSAAGSGHGTVGAERRRGRDHQFGGGGRNGNRRRACSCTDYQRNRVRGNSCNSNNHRRRCIIVLWRLGVLRCDRLYAAHALMVACRSNCFSARSS